MPTVLWEVSQFQSLLAKPAENMYLVINKTQIDYVMAYIHKAKEKEYNDKNTTSTTTKYNNTQTHTKKEKMALIWTKVYNHKKVKVWFYMT